MRNQLLADPKAATCNGPDAWGTCPDRVAGRTPACRGATWLIRGSGERTWQFRFPTESDTCPLLLLDPTARLPELWVG